MADKTSLRLTEEQRVRLQHHLFPEDGREAIALALCGTLFSSGQQIFCIHDIIEVPWDACILRTDIAVRWDVKALVPVLERAIKSGLFILKIHSHPKGYEQFSMQDNQTDLELTKSIETILERSPSLISAFMTPEGKIYARKVLAETGFEPVEQVMIVGDAVTFMQQTFIDKCGDLDLRTRQAFGDGTTNLLRSLSIGVAGCSGTGSWVVEMLGRLGVGHLVLVDPDTIEMKNLNRIVNSTLEDAHRKRPKVDALADAIRVMGFGTNVNTHSEDLAHPDVIKALARCDFLFGCMDSADGRDMLNRIATYYLVPYVDVGVRLDADGLGGIEQICCAVHYLIPGGSSLLSRGVITSEQVHAQAMRRTNPEQYAALQKEGYIKGIAVDRPAVVSVNGFAATHAVNEMLARLHPFRRDPNEEFRYQIFSLSDGAWLRLPDGSPCKLLARYVGRGDAQPLLGNPALS
jgi:hypothetical protein